MTTSASLRFHVRSQRVRGLATAFGLALTAAGTAAAEQTPAASAAVHHISHTAYLGTGLVSSASWLLNSTPDPPAFALLGAGFIGLALLGRKKLAR
jgi:hypothetical protein